MLWQKTEGSESFLNATEGAMDIKKSEIDAYLFRLGFEQASGLLGDLIGRSAKGREVAVFDFDNTCIINDIGEIFSYYLVDWMRYRYDLDAFWDLIDPRDGRDELRELVTEIQASGDWAAHPLFETYSSEMNAIYTRRLEREGKRDCYAWAVRLHVGLSETQMHTWSNQAILSELARPLETQVLGTRRGEEISVSRGIRPIFAIRELMRLLDLSGVEVWICSATNIWTVREFGRHFGIPSERVIGNRVVVQEGLLSAELIEPAMFREGKRVAIEREIGVQPSLVVGDSETDFGMLEYAKFPLFLDTGSNSDYSRYAEGQGWTVISRDQLKQQEDEHGRR